MVSTNNFINATGTYSQSFQLGNGATIYQGSGTPNNSIGVSGDVYISTTLGVLFVKENSVWVEITESTGSIVNVLYATQFITGTYGTTVTATIGSGVTYQNYLSVFVTAPYCTSALILPSNPSAGTNIFVKDLSGTASTLYPIRISNTINSDIFTIDIPYGVLKILYTGVKWVVVSSLTSFPMNEMKLSGGLVSLGTTSVGALNTPQYISPNQTISVSGTSANVNQQTLITLSLNSNNFGVPKFGDSFVTVDGYEAEVSQFVNVLPSGSFFTTIEVPIPVPYQPSGTFAQTAYIVLYDDFITTGGTILANIPTAISPITPLDYVYFNIVSETTIPDYIEFSGAQTIDITQVEFGISDASNVLPTVWQNATVSSDTFSGSYGPTNPLFYSLGNYSMLTGTTYSNHAFNYFLANYYLYARNKNNISIIGISNEINLINELAPFDILSFYSDVPWMIGQVGITSFVYGLTNYGNNVMVGFSPTNNINDVISFTTGSLHGANWVVPIIPQSAGEFYIFAKDVVTGCYSSIGPYIISDSNSVIQIARQNSTSFSFGLASSMPVYNVANSNFNGFYPPQQIFPNINFTLFSNTPIPSGITGNLYITTQDVTSEPQSGDLDLIYSSACSVSNLERYFNSSTNNIIGSSYSYSVIDQNSQIYVPVTYGTFYISVWLSDGSSINSTPFIVSSDAIMYNSAYIPYYQNNLISNPESQFIKNNAKNYVNTNVPFLVNGVCGNYGFVYNNNTTNSSNTYLVDTSTIPNDAIEIAFTTTNIQPTSGWIPTNNFINSTADILNDSYNATEQMIFYGFYALVTLPEDGAYFLWMKNTNTGVVIQALNGYISTSLNNTQQSLPTISLYASQTNLLTYQYIGMNVIQNSGNGGLNNASFVPSFGGIFVNNNSVNGYGIGNTISIASNATIYFDGVSNVGSAVLYIDTNNTEVLPTNPTTLQPYDPNNEPPSFSQQIQQNIISQNSITAVGLSVDSGFPFILDYYSLSFSAGYGQQEAYTQFSPYHQILIFENNPGTYYFKLAVYDINNVLLGVVVSNNSITVI
jgi:hypothetical protein